MAGPGHALDRFEDADLGRRARHCRAPVGAFSLLPSCGASQARNASGSATVAERPMRRAAGACASTRDSASDSSTPRFEVTSECNSSSTMTVLRSFSICAAPGSATRSETCSGVVMRMSGGFSRWRLRRNAACRRCASRCVTGKPISRDRRFEIARDIDGERLERRDVERVDAAALMRCS